MAKISDIEAIRKKLVLGEIECKSVWELDNQKKLKGNPLKAFETCLKRICRFEKFKIGRCSYYDIIEIYDVIKERERYIDEVPIEKFKYKFYKEIYIK